MSFHVPLTIKNVASFFSCFETMNALIELARECCNEQLATPIYIALLDASLSAYRKL
jgi:hypothetical protein